MYIFVNFIHILLNRRQLDSHICLCIQSSVLSYVMMTGKLTVYSQKNRNENNKYWLSNIMKIFFISKDFLKESWAGSRQNFETHHIRQ